MPHADLDRLRSIKTLASLVAYLRDELDWPIESDDIEDISFDYTSAELGIAAEAAVRIKEIKQLRPLSGNQPWGIFWVNFEKKRLPVVVMRLILRALVLKKRASPGQAERQAWAAHDLLFISAYGEESDRAVSFAHFVENPGNNLAELRVLGWDDDDTPLHMDYVAQMLHAKLRWDDKLAAQPDAWRKQWSDAFLIRHRHVVRTSEELATTLAALARRIRSRIRTVLRSEDGSGEMRKLQRAFQTGLIHDLDDEGFADMFAQTVTYGLFSLACRRTIPGEGTAFAKDDLSHYFTSPFLKEMLGVFLGIKSRKGAIDFDELGVSDVTDLLTSPDTHMEVVLADFNNKTRGEDPVIHFYEHFLTAYNKQLKIQRGVFYTPQPVVSYIVRSVHELLQTEFGLEDGLASTVTWGEMIARSERGDLPGRVGVPPAGLGVPPKRTFAPIGARHPDQKAATQDASLGGQDAHPTLKLPPLTDEPGEKRTISPDEPFVQILDPATGTATFLVEVIDVIHRHLAAKWKTNREALPSFSSFIPHPSSFETYWNAYVPAHLLTRLHAFELMMAPYAIAHMKIGLKLAETGYRFGTEERARIYLTNALEPKVKQLPQIGFDALAHEAAAVNEIKWYKRFTVVMGNPPYSIKSWNAGEWITNLTEDYKRTVRGEESQIQALSNDYIKFLRFGEWQIERTRIGVLGLITGHGYLQGTQPRDLRNHLSGNFDQCYCLDLHGSVRRAGTHDSEDEPVFEIMTGVAIFIGSRAVAHGDRAVTVLESLTGRLEKKFSYLRKGTALRTELTAKQHTPAAPNFYFAASATAQDIGDEYHRYPDLPAIFGTGNRQTDKEVFWATGSASQQDELAMSFTRAELEQKMSALAESRSFIELKQSYRLCTTDQWNYSEAKDFARQGLWRQHVGRVAYRPFDRQWTVLHKHVLTILRKKVMSQLSGKERNLGLITSRAVNDLSFAHCFVTDEPVDKIFISSKTSTNAYVFPLFFKDEDMYGQQRRPNFSRSFLALLAQTLAVPKDGKHGLPAGLTPEDIFHYAYAVFHSPGYRSRYAEFLKIDFPRLPLTGNLELFRALARLGGELTALHLLESPLLGRVGVPPAGEGVPPERTSATAKVPRGGGKAAPQDASLGGQDAHPTREHPDFIGRPNPVVEKISWSRHTVWVDKAQTIGFQGVREDVWNFHIGGYQVCEKWLKDRKGRTLTKGDLAHYQRIVVALSETIRLMAEIDEVINEHGGWPGAFTSITAS